ncbi:MAG: Hsp20/alpha crystallin family protein [Phycisphaerales bacterium]|nr:Hsp20/alpha crystallin family protein [Phycisphaerales bacterium]
MLLRRMTPVPGFGLFRQDMENLFDDFFSRFDGPTRRTRGFPPLNIWEDDERLFVEADVPGLTMNDIDIEVMGNELTIKGRRETPNDEETTYHRRERGMGEFARMITLPVNIDPNNVEAVLKNGVLTVTLPKAEVAKVRKIEVKTEN